MDDKKELRRKKLQENNKKSIIVMRELLIEKYNSYIGKKFNRLTITGLREKLYKNKERIKTKIVLIYVCECGKVGDTYPYRLDKGNHKSCGCHARELLIQKSIGRTSNRLPAGVAGMNALFSRTKSAAKNRGHSFELSRSQLEKITKSNCFYCNIEPKQRAIHIGSHRCYTKDGYDNAQTLVNGIDRIDNEIGYIYSNCVPCCETCNKMKKHLSVTYWFEHMQKILNKLARINNVILQNIH